MNKKTIMMGLGVLFLSWGVHASVIVTNFTFETTQDGWSFVKPETGTPGQATASTGEGVLQAQSRLSGADKMQFRVTGLAAAPSAGQTWDLIEFRVRQLEDAGSGAPGTPLATVDTTSTLFYLNDYNDDIGSNITFGAFDSSSYWAATTADADGWVTYTVDLGQYLVDNSMTLNGNMPRIRIDPLAKGTLGRWAELDYVTVVGIGSEPNHVMAFDRFAYSRGRTLAVNEIRLDGGVGWGAAWQKPPAGGGGAAKVATPDYSLWFGNAPEFSPDGSGHLNLDATAVMRGAIRNWSDLEGLGTDTLYFSALIRGCSTNPVQASFEFFTGAGGSGDVAMNVGLINYNSNGVSRLYAASGEGGIPVSPSVGAATADPETTYLLVAKWTGSQVSASLIEGDGAISTLVEPVTWDVSTNSIITNALSSLKLTAFSGVLMLDELRVAASFEEVVTGLPLEPETQLIAHTPADGSTVYQTIPYFDWTDKAAYPYPGTYEIEVYEDSNPSVLFDSDTVPGHISWYSPVVECNRGESYTWRVRYVAENGTPGSWAPSTSFTVGTPAFVREVVAEDDWREIKEKFAEVEAFAATNSGGAELRFPENQTFNLTQDWQSADDDYLFTGDEMENGIINGQGSLLVIRCTSPQDPAVCGFLKLYKSVNLQLQNLRLDYASDSLAQYGGVISNLNTNENNYTFTVTVDTHVYANLHETAEVVKGVFCSGETGANIDSVTVTESWTDAQDSGDPSLFHFTRVIPNNLEERLRLHALKNGDIYYAAPVPDRGGVVIAVGNSYGFLANRFTTYASRAQWGTSSGLYPRFLNSACLRGEGRILGSCSGGFNTISVYGWFENMRMESVRDDTYHNNGRVYASDLIYGQTVFRRSVIKSGQRASIWEHGDRCWIAENRVMYGANACINLGHMQDAVNSTFNGLVHVGLVEKNTIIKPVNAGIATESSPSYSLDPEIGLHHKQVTIRDNTVIDATLANAFRLKNLDTCTVENNRVCNSIDGWVPGTPEEEKVAFFLSDCTGIDSSVDNLVYDSRLTTAGDRLTTTNCSQITMTVVDHRTTEEDPVFLLDPFRKPEARDTVYEESLEFNAIDYNGDPLVFTKVSGPSWIKVAANGTLSGTPSVEGLGSWVVQVSDGRGTDSATMEVYVTASGAMAPEFYDVWSDSYDLQEGPMGHDDADGVDNWTEYVLGGDPKDASNVGYPISLIIQDDSALYVHPQRSEANSGIRYIVEASDNLVSNRWTTVEATATNYNGFAAGIDEVTNGIPMGVKTQQFMRLRIEAQ